LNVAGMYFLGMVPPDNHCFRVCFISFMSPLHELFISRGDDGGVSCQNPVTTAPLAVDRIFPGPSCTIVTADRRLRRATTLQVDRKVLMRRAILPLLGRCGPRAAPSAVDAVCERDTRRMQGKETWSLMLRRETSRCRGVTIDQFVQPALVDQRSENARQSNGALSEERWPQKPRSHSLAGGDGRPRQRFAGAPIAKTQ
jgi:hypothetical protein